MAEEKKDAYALTEVTAKTYAEQGQFFLNAFWQEHGGDAEKVWQWCKLFCELDFEKHENGSDLNEVAAHQFLEKMSETTTALAMREALRTIDLDFNRRMALVEYLMWKFKADMKLLLNRPQGTNEDLIRAQKALRTVQEEIEKIEKEKARLEKESTGSGVKGQRAKAELSQLLSADNTALNRAVLSAEAAVRKAQKSNNLQAQGTLWWINRQLEEARKYKPQKKA